MSTGVEAEAGAVVLPLLGVEVVVVVVVAAATFLPEAGVMLLVFVLVGRVTRWNSPASPAARC